MDGICYICNQQSTAWRQNFAEIKSKHTQTPIIDFIRQFLVEFHSARNISVESNCICAECLQQIDLYDWMRQQVSEQGTKLRDLLLATETTLCVKSEPTEIKEEIEDWHNDDGALASDAILQNNFKDQITTVPTHPEEITSPVLQHPKPFVSYRCLIAMALKNSRTGLLPTSEIFSFVSEHFPYFKTAVEDWKGTIRKTLSSQESFLKTGPQMNSAIILACSKNLWTMNPSNVAKLDKEFQRCLSDWESNVLSAMAIPENLPALMRGEMKHGRMHCGGSVLGLGAEHIQAESHSSDSQPARKRARQFNEPSFASTSTCETTSSTASNSQSKMELKCSRPSYSYACLIAIALKNACTGSLLTSEICSFISVHFPYYRTAAENWRRNVRNGLTSNQNFLKTQYVAVDGVVSNKWLWSIDPLQWSRMDGDIQKLSQFAEVNTMAVPENLPALLRGEMKHGGRHKVHIETAEEISKPKHSFRFLVAMALKNSHTGSLPVNEIYNFISEHFPYFKTAPNSWKSSVRDVLSNSLWFEKIPNKANRRNLWTLNQSKVAELEIEIRKSLQSNPITDADKVPENQGNNMELGCSNDSYKDDTSDSEPEHERIDLNSNGEHGIEADKNFDEIEIDDSKSFQFQIKC